MNALLQIARIIVGVLFIFSGLVKANDPLGLSYKMQEYFEVWQFHSLNQFALALALVMNVFEIVAGIALLLGWRMKLFSWLLLLLIVFFTFLTGYAAFSGRIAACGCFGDCIPLKPLQSFWKDVVLLVLIVLLLVFHRRVRPLVSPRTAVITLFASVILVAGFQWYVLGHLPVVDCLPYKKGNDLLQQMKPPANAVPDQYSYVFRYRKNGQVLEFSEDSLPEDLDDRYEFLGREEKLVKKGNGLVARITDFNLVTQSGNDTTQAILAQPGRYILVWSDETDPRKWGDKKYDLQFWKELQARMPVFIVASVPVLVEGITVLKCDGTVIKTAARARPTYFLMQGARILGKFSYANTEELIEMVDRNPGK